MRAGGPHPDTRAAEPRSDHPARRGRAYRALARGSGVQLERIRAGTYEGHEVDIDALDARFLEAMRDQPWHVAWTQANAGRTRMLEVWYVLDQPTKEAAWWVRRSGADHYAEHLGRLREWVAELIRRRT